MTDPTPSTRAGLRDDIARAIHRYDNHHALSGNDIPSKHHRGEADAVLTLLYREWPWLQAEAEESSRPSPAACGHEPELDRLTAELADYDERAEQQKQRADRAEDTATRVTGLYEQWVKAGPPPLGASMARWWDARLVELHGAIRPATEQPARTTAGA